jgi:hypothetical protein
VMERQVRDARGVRVSDGQLADREAAEGRAQEGGGVGRQAESSEGALDGDLPRARGRFPGSRSIPTSIPSEFPRIAVSGRALGTRRD